MSKAIVLTDENFTETTKSNHIVFVDFWATRCNPCKALLPIIDDLANEYKDLVVAKLNIDDNPLTPEKYSVFSVPTLIVFKGSKDIARLCGFKSKADIKVFIDTSLDLVDLV